MKRTVEGEKMDMTPMIDIVFQLLIFFVIAFRSDDLIAHLDVSRPSGVNPDPLAAGHVQVTVAQQGYLVNERLVSLQTLTSLLGRIAHFGTNQAVLVACNPDAEHGRLVRVLDACHSVELEHIALVSK